MATRLPSALPRRPTTALPFTALQTTTTTTTTTIPSSHTPFSRTPSRAATLIKRPRRPYTFTQLVQLSDGSTYTMRTSSPLALYKSTKDARNHVLWNPNEQSLQNVEVDEAGRLAAFRGRFGRGWDVAAAAATPEDGAGEDANKAGGGSGAKDVAESEDAFADLIAGYAANMPDQQPKSSKPPPEKKKK